MTAEQLEARQNLGESAGRSSLTDQAFSRLREGLLPGGELANLDQLVEDDLAQRLEMSRTPVREALKRLSSVGVVTEHSSGGYVLRLFSTREVIDHYHVRMLLEPLSASWAASRDEAIRAELLRNPGLTPNHSSPAADRDFHKALAIASNSRALIRIVNQFVDRLAREGVHAYGNSDEEVELGSGHELVIAAIAEGDPVRAEKAMRAHLELLLKLIPRSRRTAAESQRGNFGTSDRPSLADRAYSELKSAVLSAEISGGTVLTESFSAQALKVSRTTARQALRQLEDEEYLERDARGSLVVRSSSPTEFIQECEIRKVLDGEAARLAAIRISEDELVALETLLDDDADSLRTNDDARRAMVNTQIHRAIAVASRNKALLETSDDLRERTFGFGRVAFAIGSANDRKTFAAEHREIVKLLRSGDGDLAAEVVRNHISRSCDLLLDQMQESDKPRDT